MLLVISEHMGACRSTGSSVVRRGSQIHLTEQKKAMKERLHAVVLSVTIRDHTRNRDGVTYVLYFPTASNHTLHTLSRSATPPVNAVTPNTTVTRCLATECRFVLIGSPLGFASGEFAQHFNSLQSLCGRKQT